MKLRGYVQASERQIPRHAAIVLIRGKSASLFLSYCVVINLCAASGIAFLTSQKHSPATELVGRYVFARQFTDGLVFSKFAKAKRANIKPRTAERLERLCSHPPVMEVRVLPLAHSLAYSAAWAVAAFSTLAAQNLYSGILP
jgi:hypothetical protein